MTKRTTRQDTNATAKPRARRPAAMPKASEHLCWLAAGLSQSGSRVEDHWWEGQLEALVDQLLEEGNERELNEAIEHLFRSDDAAYGELMDVVESESALLRESDGVTLLVAAPILAWSRFSVPAKNIPKAALEHLRTSLANVIFAPGVQFAIADHIFSPDQLPEGYVATRRFLAEMGAAARAEKDYAVDGKRLAQTVPFLSDIRYLLIAAFVPHGAPVFRWQTPETSRDQAFAEWRKRVHPVFERLLPGCGLEEEPVDAYFTATMKASRSARVFAIGAAVAFLATEYDIAPGALRAVVAFCASDEEEEFRIGFVHKATGRVIHGVPWALIGTDEDEGSAREQIVKALKAFGIDDIEVLHRTLPLEYCEDCGAPLFPNSKGELEHAESPAEDEESEDPLPRQTPPRYLH